MPQSWRSWLMIAGYIGWIIDHLKLRLIAAKPPPSRIFEQVALMAAEESGNYF